MSGSELRALELKLPPLALLVICGAAMWSLSKALPVATFAFPAAATIALAVAIAGMAVGLSGILTFLHHKTTVNPLHPEEASVVVSSGIYRYTRNPMYLGLAIVLIAWAIYLRNVAAVIPIPAFIAYMTRFQIQPEERAMLTNFGADYKTYMSAVRRWL